MTESTRPFKTGWQLPRKARNLKTVLQEEQKMAAQAPPDTPNYFNCTAAPSMRPTKRYCDITGLPASYTTTHGLRYHNKDVYEIIKTLGAGVDQEYLKVRNANLVLK